MSNNYFDETEEKIDDVNETPIEESEIKDPVEPSKEKPEIDNVDSPEAPSDEQESQIEGTEVEKSPEEETEKQPEEKKEEVTDAEIEVIDPDYFPEKKPYHERYYMLYGYEEVPEVLDVNGTSDLLKECGFENNFLKMAREGKGLSEFIEQKYATSKKKIYCDFCGVELIGTELTILRDGRKRCTNCTRTAIRKANEFKKLYDNIIDNLKLFFGIEIHGGVSIKMVNSRALHKRIGKSFVPTAEPTARVLGVAIKGKRKDSGFAIYIENGAPRLCAMKTLVHELTHIWQYQNWDEKEILQKYGKEKNIAIYEGMAKWVEIQYMYLLGETATARREELETESRNDEYGIGFRMYTSVYPLSYGMCLEGYTPFDDVHNPLMVIEK